MMRRAGGGKPVRHAPLAGMQSAAASHAVALACDVPVCFGANRSH